ncbi:MAG: hypothetical protein ACR2RB_10225, partial [Gammaproteobacteria bacterium]
MAKEIRYIGAPDSAGPSRDGHEFHEAWTARKAMQLLLPSDGLIGIAVEGLSKEDGSRASAATIEIADLTIYYGKDANFTNADRIETVQFKYSPKIADEVFRASHAKKTIKKFAASYIDYKKNYGAADVTKKLFFELITNRPILPDLLKAIEGIATGKRLAGDIKKQGDQFKSAAGLSGDELKEFASKCQIKGLAGTLKDTKADLRKIVIDWSATTDAGARLGDIRDMVRKKAGYQEEHRKVIRQVDVLNALELSEVEDLLPCPTSLADVGDVVAREQLAEAIDLIPSLIKPLPGLLHKLNDRTKLFELAFDERFPESIPSTLGRRRIRYARLRAAVVQSASDKDWNKLVQLLVELSGVAASDQKGADFILDNPDLVINANDADALRRLFETRTKWPGARHARLAIANILSGATDDASRHLRNAVEWIRHDLQASDDDYNRVRPERLDRAAIPFYWIIQQQPKRAIGFMRYWYDWYGFEIVERVCGLMRYAMSRDSTLRRALQGFIAALGPNVDCLAGFLCFIELTEAE